MLTIHQSFNINVSFNLFNVFFFLFIIGKLLSPWPQRTCKKYNWQSKRENTVERISNCYNLQCWMLSIITVVWSIFSTIFGIFIKFPRASGQRFLWAYLFLAWPAIIIEKIQISIVVVVARHPTQQILGASMKTLHRSIHQLDRLSTFLDSWNSGPVVRLKIFEI